MKGELNKQSTFGDIKIWFDENKSLFPITLDAQHIYYNDVTFTAELYISQIISEFQRLGAQGIKNSAVAKSGKNNLYNLYLSLQNVDKWDTPRPSLGFNNY